MSALAFALIALLLGAAFCFAGYRFFLVMLPIWGFFAGLWIGAYTVSAIFGTGLFATTAGLVVGVVVGIVGAILSYLFYIVGVAIVAAAIGGALGSGIMTAIGFDPGFLVTLVTIISALIAVGLTLWFSIQKYVIIALSAILGADLIVISVLLVFGQVTVAQIRSSGNLIQPMVEASWFWTLVWLALAAVGFVFQLRTNRTYDFTKETYVENWG
jgi:hypothetical protein